jgi:tripartite ATP-independent transporter DctP family solute receptor
MALRLSARLALLCGALAAAPLACAVETIVLVNSDAIGSPIDRMNVRFKQEVEKRSNGQIAVKYIPGDSFGSAPQVMDQVIAGSIDMFGNSLAWYSPYDKDIQIINWGFAFRDAAHMTRFFESRVFGQMEERVRQKNGIRLLAATPLQERIIFSTKPITSVKDVEGLKMRVPQIRAYLELWKEFGARPTQVAWGEVYLALKTGVVEAAEGPPSAAGKLKFHEAARELSISNHVFDTAMFVINEKRFARLTADQQKLVTEVARESAAWIRAETAAETKKDIDAMVAAGARIHTLNTAAFREKAVAGVTRLEAEGLWSKGLYQSIQDVK